METELENVKFDFKANIEEIARVKFSLEAANGEIARLNGHLSTKDLMLSDAKMNIENLTLEKKSMQAQSKMLLQDAAANEVTTSFICWFARFTCKGNTKFKQSSSEASLESIQFSK